MDPLWIPRDSLLHTVILLKVPPRRGPGKSQKEGQEEQLPMLPIGFIEPFKGLYSYFKAI